MEETGLTVTNTSLLRIIKSMDDPRNPNQITIFYKVNAIGEISNPDKNENSDIQWLSIDSPIDIGWENHKLMLEFIKSHRSDFYKIS